ncbi:MAG: hypothetical protein FP821_05925 [Sideroxydans sp.]|nr:hypothetical protein [Sideroxydans sp.]
MRDQDLRYELLKEIYDQRAEDHVQIGLGAMQSPEQSERIRIARQLAEHGLIKFQMLNLHLGGLASITAEGVDVMEGAVKPPIAMNIDQRQTININGSSNFQVGHGNTQEIQAGVSILLNAIEKSDASPQQKEEAKTLLRKFLEHPLVSAVAGGAIGLLG